MGQKNSMKVLVTDHGLWRIDNETGKILVLLELRQKNGNAVLQYVPTHNDCVEFLKMMLEAELRNDKYDFKNPVDGNKYHVNDGKHHRPPQLNDKLKRIEDIIAEYKKENGHGELLKKRPSKKSKSKRVKIVDGQKKMFDFMHEFEV